MAEVEEIKIATVVEDGGTRKTLSGLRKEANGLKDDLLNLTKGSAEYTEKLSELRGVQQQVTVALREGREVSKTLDQSLRDVANASAGIVGGFNAVKAAGVLLGEENEALQKTFVQLQAGMALVQGLRQLGNGFFSLKALIPQVRVAFQAFNVTLMSNPIIAVATAIVALIAGLALLGNAVANNKSGVDELKQGYEDFQDSIADLQKEQDFEIRKLKALGATEKEIAEARLGYAKERAGLVEDAKREVDDEIAYLESKWKPWFSGQRKRLKELRKQQEAYAEQLEEIVEEIEEEVTNIEIEEIKERTTARNNAAKAAEAEAKRLAAELAKAEEQLSKNLKSIWGIREAERIATLKPQERLDEIDKELKKQQDAAAALALIAHDEEADTLARAAASEKLLEAENALIALRTEQAALNATLKQEEDLRIAQAEAQRLAIAALTEQEREQAELRLRRTLDDQQQLQLDITNAETRKALADAEIERLEAELLKDIEDNEVRIQLLKDLEEAREQSFEQEQTIYNARKKLDADELARKKKDAADKKKIEEQTLATSANFLNAASSLLGENTAAGKATAVAGATINTYLAGTQALASYPPPASYIALAATIATGLATVKNILSTKVPGASDSVSAPTTEVPALPSFPELDSPIQETHNNMDGFDEDVLNRPQSVLVVEDFNNVNNRVQVAEGESTF